MQGFEPWTSTSRTWRAAKLRYIPMLSDPRAEQRPQSIPVPPASFQPRRVNGRYGATMPAVDARVTVPVPPEVAFAVSQTTGEVRRRWDPFIRRQRFLGGALLPAVGVRTRTIHRLGLAMTSEYVSYNPPTSGASSDGRSTPTWNCPRIASATPNSRAARSDCPHAAAIRAKPTSVSPTMMGKP